MNNLKVLCPSTDNAMRLTLLGVTLASHMKNDMVNHMALVLPMESQDIASCGSGSGFIVVVEEAFRLLWFCSGVHNALDTAKDFQERQEVFSRKITRSSQLGESSVRYEMSTLHLTDLRSGLHGFWEFSVDKKNPPPISR
jgi:hypothetical protein